MELGGGVQTFNNFTKICVSAGGIHSTGVFTGANPLEFKIPLLFLQLGICSGTILLLSQILKPLGQPLIVSQILGGLVLGSSGLSQMKIFRETIFPIRGFISLDVVASLGQIFYFFLIGVQTDVSIVKKIDKRAFGIGFCSVFLPMILTTIYPIAFVNIVDNKTFESLFAVGKVETFIHFSMVASLLFELRLINSEFGRIALSSAMVSNFISCGFAMISLMMAPQSDSRSMAFSIVYASIVAVVFLLLATQPVIWWMMKQNPVGQPLKEGFVITLFLGVLVAAFCSQASGVQIYYGPLLLGITIPPGPPIGSTLLERLDSIISWVFMPVFFVKIGLAINIYAIQLKNFLCVSFIVFVSAVGKFLGAVVIALYCKLPTRDAISLGLVLNSQGALELGLFKIMKFQAIGDEEFVAMCTSLVVLVAIITPIIRYLFDPSRRYVVNLRRTVMHSRPNFDLRVLVSIHDQEDVPSAINLLQALNPTRRSHLVVYMVHLVELLGRANPQLIHHKLTKVITSRSCPSKHIVNAFKYFGQSNHEIVAMHPFTAISPSTTMHDDICSLALDKKTSLVLVPFHKRFHSNGKTSLSKHKIKVINHHVLDKAPCSVALVVERGILNVPKSVATSLSPFQIAMVFIGGPDDREAMFIAARMAGHPNINLTMIRLLDNRNVPGINVKERMLDNEAMGEFRQVVAENYNVRYIEEVVKDGNETVCVLRSMGDNFDLVMVGRRHNTCSALVRGLVLWNEYTELGAIGEVLASSDFMGNATILVVQQHTTLFNKNQDHHLQTNELPIQIK